MARAARIYLPALVFTGFTRILLCHYRYYVVFFLT
jgi:hypothetical protein